MKKTKLLSTLLALVLLLSLGACSTQEEERVIVPYEPIETSEESAPEVGEILSSGLFGFEIDGILYFATGKMSFNETTVNASITKNIDEAPIFTVTETTEDNAYYLSCEIEGETQYLYFTTTRYSGNNNKLVVGYTSTPSLIYYDSELGLFIDSDNTHYFCETYGYLATCDIVNDNYMYTPARLYSYPEITGMKISSSEESVTEGHFIDLDVSYTPSNIGKSTLYWSSSDPSIAVVDNGRVTGVSVGTCTISATTTNGKKADYEVTVLAKTGATASKSITIDSLSVRDDLGVFAGDNISTKVSTYDAFDISWNPNGDPTHHTIGLFIRNEVSVTSYQKGLYISQNQEFIISPKEGTTLTKLHIIGCSNSNNNGVYSLNLTNTDYDYDYGPTKIDSVFDEIETNVVNGTEDVVFTNVASTSIGQVNIYSIVVDYTVTI